MRTYKFRLGEFLEDDKIIKSVRHWVETVVVGLNLCPFAKRELVNDRVRFVVSDAETEVDLLAALQTELNILEQDDAIETTLLIHPNVLQDFYDYNEFLDAADGLLVEMDRDGIIQVASFHPDYQFAETEAEDVENYTNRSPYPLLHLIREESLEQAIAAYPNADAIPERNINLLRELGKDKMRAMFGSHFEG